MKKIRRYLPVLILVLALLILFWPAGNNDTGTEPALPTTEPVSSSPDAGALPDGGELQLLEPSPDPETQTDHSESESEQPPEEALLPEDGSYTSKEEVSLYLMTYGHLPFNFVTKDEAEKAGWNGADGTEAAWNTFCRANASAATASATERASSRRQREEPGASVTSTHWGNAPAGRNGWFTRTTD